MDPDPRPSIAARLDHEFLDRLGWASTQHILDTEIPQGAPWAARWEAVPGVFAPVLTRITSGGVRAWLLRHPEVMDEEGIEL